MSNPEDLLSVIRDINSPPGGWRYTPPETGVTLTASFYGELRDKVVRHLRANGFEADEDVIQDGACRESPSVPPGWCRKRDPKPIAGMPIPLLSAVESFLRCTWQAILSRKFVPREEAERRLSVCMGCPMRGASPGGCGGCYDLLRKAKDLLGGKSALTIEPDEDGTVRDTCQACLCVLPLKVFLTTPTLEKCEGERKPPYAPGCWRLEK